MLSGPASTDTVVNYTVAGTATSGSDFTPLSGSVTITAGSTTATISVPVADDSLIEGTENVSVTLTGIASGDANISLGGTTVASIDVLDDDSADWTITGDAAVTEGAAATYLVDLNGDFQNGETATVDLSLADVDTTSSDYADFDAAVTAAVSALRWSRKFQLGRYHVDLDRDRRQPIADNPDHFTRCDRRRHTRDR